MRPQPRPSSVRRRGRPWAFGLGSWLRSQPVTVRASLEMHLVAVAGVDEAGREAFEDAATERVSVVVREHCKHLHRVAPSITSGSPAPRPDWSSNNSMTRSVADRPDVR